MLIDRRSGELIEFQTEDGIRLHGFLMRPQVPQPDKAANPRVWIIVHGVAGNFFSSNLLGELSDFLLSKGDSILRINTRGRESMVTNPTAKFAKRGGATYEAISDSILDLKACYDSAKELGYAQIGLIGHSLGALKSLLFARVVSLEYEKEGGGRRLENLIAISPPRFCHAELKNGSQAGEYLESLREAHENCNAGRYDHLMKVYFPFPMLISASTYLDKYGEHDRNDYLKWLTEVRVPTLFCFGTEEIEMPETGKPKACFYGADGDLERVIENGSLEHIQISTVEEADHNYTKNRNGLWSSIQDWLA